MCDHLSWTQFTLLTPLEPRLVRKLLPPLRQLISSTSAMSLLYECINAVIVGGMLEAEGGDELAASCVDKLATFLEDIDQNLRYMALLALVRLLPTHPGLVARHYDEILRCLDDADITIRSRALSLIDGMVNRSNLQEIVEQLMRHLAPPSSRPAAASSSAIDALSAVSRGESSSVGSSVAVNSPTYRRSLIVLILDISTRSTYANVSNFPWLIDTICSLASFALSIPGVPDTALSDAVVDVAARVRAARPYIAQRMAKLLLDQSFVANAVESGGAPLHLLAAATWVVGEYARHVLLMALLGCR